MKNEREVLIDRRTGRKAGDHGTGSDAIAFALDVELDPGNQIEFLRAWREGALDEWPEFYTWLAERESLSPPPADEGVERLKKALEPFARDHLSSEPHTSNLVHRDLADLLRIQANIVEQRDADILRAREALSSFNQGGER